LQDENLDEDNIITTGEKRTQRMRSHDNHEERDEPSKKRKRDKKNNLKR